MGKSARFSVCDNVHGFTPLESIRLLTGQAEKELDAETGLNYFCQRYYDSQIGRFVSLDTWTNLPDDERLLSYEKYLSWDNYRLNYTPQIKRNPVNYSSARKNLVFAYDSLQSSLLSIFPVTSTNFIDLQVYTNHSQTKKQIISRDYFHRHQLNSYLYCTNNPLRYIDPTGHSFDPETFWKSVFSGCIGLVSGSLVGMLTRNPYLGALAGLGAGIGASLWYDRYWDFIMQYGPIWEWDDFVWELWWGR